MHQKITQTVDRYPYTYSNCPIILPHQSQHDTQPAWNGKNQEKNIVLLKKTRFMLMMILMKEPHPAVHQILVRKPCYKLHGSKSGQYDDQSNQSKIKSEAKNAICTTNK